MGVTIWNGLDPGNEGKWDTAANWDNGVPSAANSAQFLFGNQDVTGDLTPAQATILGIYTGPGYTGNIATADTFLVLTAVTNHIDIQGGNQVYIQTGADCTNGVRVRNEASGGTLHLKTGTGGSSMTRLKYEKGYVIYYEGTIVKALGDWRTSISSDSRLKIPVGGGTITLLLTDGGALVQEGGTITECIAHKTSLTFTDGTCVSLATYDSTTLWHTTSTITLGEIHGGSFDASGDGRAKTITTIRSHGDARVNLDNGRGNITVGTTEVEGPGDFTPPTV